MSYPTPQNPTFPTTGPKTILTRSDFKLYCLRRLGFPTIEINVDDDQIEDRIDDALQYWQDYHFDGLQSQIDELKQLITNK